MIRLRRHKTHDWFPSTGPREYLPVTEGCLSCRAQRVLPPWGECLGGHPIAEHYQGTEVVEVPGCKTNGPW